MLSKILLLCTFFELGDFVQIEEFQNQKFRRSNNTYNPILKHLTLMSIIDQLNKYENKKGGCNVFFNSKFSGSVQCGGTR